jgi:prepilin-type N-terminal cleavage/methylation domain-containing protein
MKNRTVLGATLRGFTLIELLVVIAIIAALAAIVFPVFSTVRDDARETACLSNLRQISAANLMYAQDNDDYPVWGGDPVDLNIESEYDDINVGALYKK